MEEAVFFKSANGRIYVKATGHATAFVCPSLKAAVFGRLDSPPSVEGVYFDLSDCEYMDSTFLGLIVGTQKRFGRLTILQRGAVGSIVLLGVNEACKGLLRTIGVLGMVEISDADADFPEDLERLSGEPRTERTIPLGRARRAVRAIGRESQAIRDPYDHTEEGRGCRSRDRER